MNVLFWNILFLGGGASNAGFARHVIRERERERERVREGLLRKSENAFMHVQVANSSTTAQAQFSTKNTFSKHELEKNEHIMRES